jgi:hypothetical protein
MSSNLKQFNSTFKEFLTNLITIFPQTQTSILNHYRPLLEDGEFDPVYYCKDFVSRASEYKTDIADKNEEMFHHSICLFPGIDFELIWNSDFNTPKTKKSIWIYLNLFTSLGSRIMLEEAIKQKKYENLSDEDKCLVNLKEATEEFQTEKVSSKENFLKTLSDKELIVELERRKADRSERKAEDDNEEDLLNFDPNQEYSLWNSIKGMTGLTGGKPADALGGLGGIGGMLEGLSKMFGMDMGNFDVENIDIGNIGNMVKEAVTPENMQKLSEQALKFASEFQSDIDSGDIDKSELTNMFQLLKDNLGQMASGDMSDPEKQKDMMENMMKSTQKMFGNMVPPQMRDQFAKMQNDMMSNPAKMAEMMSNPQALMQEMMGGNRGMQNKYNTATRNEQARNRLAKLHEERKKQRTESDSKMNESSSEPIALLDKSPTSTNKKKRKNKKKKKITTQNTTDQDTTDTTSSSTMGLSVEDLDVATLDLELNGLDEE